MIIPVSEKEIGILIPDSNLKDCFLFRSLSRSEFKDENNKRSACRNFELMTFCQFKIEYPFPYRSNQHRCKDIEYSHYSNYWK